MLAWVMNLGFAASNLIGPNVNWPYYTNPYQVALTTYNDAPTPIDKRASDRKPAG